MSGDSTGLKIKSTTRRILQQQSTEDGLTWIPETTTMETNVENHKIARHQTGTSDQSDGITSTSRVEIEIHEDPASTQSTDAGYAGTSSTTTIITTSSSVDTLTGDSNNQNTLSGPSSPSNLSSVTLVGSTGSNERDKDITPTQEGRNLFNYGRAPTSPLPERKRKPVPAESTEQKNGDSKADKTSKSGSPHTQEQPSSPPSLPAKPPPTVTTTHYGDASSEVVEEEICIETVTSKAITSSTVSATVKSETTPSSTVNGGRSTSPSRSTLSKFGFGSSGSGGLQPNVHLLSMNRRPSAGANVIPVAALCQHRHSLQLNGSDMGGIHKIQMERGSPRSSRRMAKTPEKTRKSIFGTPQKEKEAPRYVV